MIKKEIFAFILILAFALPSPSSCNKTQEKNAYAEPSPKSTSPSVPLISGENATMVKAWAKIDLKLIAAHYSHVTFIGHARDGSGRLFIVEQRGTIKILKDGSALSEPFLNITGKTKAGR